MRFDIIKCHGSGNDFALIDARGLDLPDTAWADVARALADRAGPVGGDGILLLTDGAGAAAFGMRIFNADGSEPETCLNGLRCVARAGLEALGLDTATVRLKTSEAEVARDADLAPGVYTVRETAGPATLAVADWPLHGEGEQIIDRPIARLSPTLAFTAVAIPNPHLIAFVDEVDEAELVRIGAICEAAPDWLPNRANVSFVHMRNDREVYVRTFERGVGLTNACGSAMGASIFVAGLTGRLPFDQPITVRNRGGLVRASASADGMVTLSGNATFEWSGSVTVEDGRARDLIVTERRADEIDAWARI
ncbi:diaminopimelate epimerase [Sphingomonas sp. Ag1]|jgi:diaminopimelate epimerase|uniref:diaminopimelate epimerase n=1 Tax=Sphingomonas sp. Ag1 TaxID=1642949 RepID=UPI000621BEDA|nr:diaminopimelate epimerase [Sphingomonas sp. Ag1]KKI18551.1 diaminopimelate epimerase [Sphingomonas sp. Ag1]